MNDQFKPSAVAEALLTAAPDQPAHGPGENLQSNVRVLTTNGNLKPDAGAVEAGREHAGLLFGTLDFIENAAHVGAVVAQGGIESGLHLGASIGHGLAAAGSDIVDGAVAVGHGAEDVASWAYNNPGKTAAIIGVGVAIVGAEVLSGGMATAVIAPMLATAGGALVTAGEGALAVSTAALSSSTAVTALNVAGGLAVIGSTVKAGVEVAYHGELSVLMDGQNRSAAERAAADQQLKADTGSAVLTGSLMGAGLLVKGAMAMRAGTTVADTAAPVATEISVPVQAVTAPTKATAPAAEIVAQNPVAPVAEIVAPKPIAPVAEIATPKPIAPVVPGTPAEADPTSIVTAYNTARQAGQSEVVINGVKVPVSPKEIPEQAILKRYQALEARGAAGETAPSAVEAVKKVKEPGGFLAYGVGSSQTMPQMEGALKLEDGTMVPALQWQKKLEHITLGFGTAKSIPVKPGSAEIVGYATDNEGVEAFVVKVDGSTTAPDGRTFHITRSLADGRKAKESNDVITKFGWKPLAQPIPINAEPVFIPAATTPAKGAAK